jgi:glutamate racemase
MRDPAARPPAIGLFDSGVGGLSLWRALRRAWPAVPLLYMADTAAFPYGGRSAEEVAGRARAMARALVAEGATLLVAACNSVSTAALAAVRAATGVPVVGTVPAIRPAAAATRSGHVAALVTPLTAQGPGYAALLAAVPPQVRVWTCACAELAALVEAGEIASARTRACLATVLAEPLAAGADAVVLGCTHYVFLAPLVRDLVSPAVRLFEGTAGVVQQVGRLLPTARAAEIPAGCCFTTGPVEPFVAVAERVLGPEAVALAPYARYAIEAYL